MEVRERLVVALDMATLEEAEALAKQLKNHVGLFKIGLELFCAAGLEGLRRIQDLAPVFLDLKFHDIPNTVQGALERVLSLDPRLVNVHALGGSAMLRAAAQAVQTHRARGGQTELLAVTVLTSQDASTLGELGWSYSPGEQVLRLAQLAQDCGCDGVVCSAWEAHSIQELCGEPFHRLCPGIRPRGSESQDQARIMTPREALDAGATWIVVGRPITWAKDPIRAVEELFENFNA